MTKVNILGVEVSDISQPEALAMVKNFIEDEFQHYIVTPNPEIVLRAKENQNIRLILNHADLALPDGFGLKIASMILSEKLYHRVTGVDFAEAVISLSEQEKWPLFLLGSRKDDIAGQAAAQLEKKYKDVKMAGAQSGGAVYSKNGKCFSNDNSLIEKIKQSGAKILFVGFGCPKQEMWIFQNLDKLPNIKLAMTVGGSIDFWAGESKRAAPALRKIGLEWAWRFLREPQRGKRICNATIIFLWKVICWRARMYVKYRENAAAFIVNQNDEVFLINRAGTKKDHWQMPQGGVDPGEDASQAALREAQEETGITNIEIIGKNPNHHTYEWPMKLQKLNYGFKGQKQTIVYLDYTGDGSDILLDNREAEDYAWVPIDDVPEKVYNKRRKMAKMAVEWFKENVKNT